MRKRKNRTEDDDDKEKNRKSEPRTEAKRGPFVSHNKPIGIERMFMAVVAEV
jgi:hypothetical protein